MIPLLSERDFR